jgi:hypothetical protein
MTDKQKIERLKIDLAECERKNGDFIAGLEARIDSLNEDVADLKNQVFTLEGATTPYRNVFERLADTRNWIDGRYAPTIKELYDNVPDLCSAVLRESL